MPVERRKASIERRTPAGEGTPMTARHPRPETEAAQSKVSPSPGTACAMERKLQVC
jgi:hypothetical protein